MNKCELYDMLAYLDLEQYEKVVAEIEKKDKEIKILKEEYVMLQNASDEVEEEKDKEIDKLTFESTKWESKFYDEAKKVDKAIEYIDKHSLFEFNGNSVRDNRARMDLLNILRGEDKE